MLMPGLQGCDTKDALSFMKQLEPYMKSYLASSSSSGKADSGKKPKSPSDTGSVSGKEPKSPAPKPSGGSTVAADRKAVKDGADSALPPDARTSEGGGSFNAPLLDPQPSRNQ
jgi:hypothetical protein